MKHTTHSQSLHIFTRAAAMLAGLFFTVTLFFTNAARTAYAAESPTTPSSGSYACILKEHTYFYPTADDSRGLFTLPTTYYVKLLEYGREYSRVEYLYDDTLSKKLFGYVKTDRLTFVDYLPKQPYVRASFSLRYQIGDAPTASDFLTEITVECTYYGDYTVGDKTYCYVLRGDSFGYVPKPATFTVAENTEYAAYLETLTSEEITPTPAEEPNSSSPAQIAILVALCLLVPVLAALILKPPRRPPYETDGE